MRLQVNLIPALAYALVMMFSNMAGIKLAVQNPAQKQQIVSSPVIYREADHQENCVFVLKGGQVILSNGFAKHSLEWKIPYKPGTSSVFL